MNDKDRLNQIETDLQRAPTVLYLEGKTDPDVLFSLLGLERPRGDIHQDVYVKGLGRGASGGTAVTELIRVAKANGRVGTSGRGGIFGILDGDGKDLTELAASFDSPFLGPLFFWKSYCIENHLANSGWPSDWGPTPDWASALAEYTPYAALNQLQRRILDDLSTLGLARFRNPQGGIALETVASVRAALGQDKHLISDLDVEAEFENRAEAIQAKIALSLADGHTQINGRWFCRHYAPSVTGKSEDRCRQEWTASIREAGGLFEIRDWWQRFTGKVP